MNPFIRKYAPKNGDEIIGQEEPVAELRRFIGNRQKKKAAMVHGPSGVGKTAAVHALANELGLEILEINASNFRNQEQINSVLGAALKQKSLFAKGKIILIDEVDALSGSTDRGGLQAITRLIEGASFPIAITANDPYAHKLNTLRSKSSMIEFKPLDYNAVFLILKKICQKEGIKHDEESLKQLARMSAGDARAAINDLQTLADKTGGLTREALNDAAERNKVETMPSALLKVFKTTKAEIALGAFDNVKEDSDEQFFWIDENLPKEYEKPEELAKAYDAISRADVFRGRIRRWQEWHFMVYVNALLTAGVATAKKEKCRKAAEYKPTGRLLKIWWANQKSMKKKAISAKIAAKTHCSTKRAMHDTLPYLQVIFRKNRDMANAIAGELGLEKEEAEWMRK